MLLLYEGTVFLSIRGKDEEASKSCTQAHSLRQAE